LLFASAASAQQFAIGSYTVSSFIFWVDCYLSTLDLSSGSIQDSTYIFNTPNQIDAGNSFFGTIDPISGVYYAVGGNELWQIDTDMSATQLSSTWLCIDMHGVNSTFLLSLATSNVAPYDYIAEAYNPQTNTFEAIASTPNTKYLWDTGLTSYDSIGTTIYGVGYSGSFSEGEVSSWDISSNTGNMVTFQGPYIVSVQYSRTNKLLYGLADTNPLGGYGYIVSIDTNTGKVNNVTQNTANYSIMTNLVIDDSVTTLYWLGFQYVNSTGQSIYSMIATNTNSGKVTTTQLSTSQVSQLGVMFGLELMPSSKKK